MPALPNPNILGPATLSVTQGITAFNSFLPKLTDIRKANPIDNPDVAGDVRMGEIAAVAITIGTGLMVSSLSGSSIPTVTAVLMCGVLICIYESALRMDLPLNPKSSPHIVSTLGAHDA
jgi:hypothetical protein